jgi:hypothetical protein
MARKLNAPTHRPAYFIHDPARGTWQLLTGIGNPVTSPRKLADDGWRSAVLVMVKQDSARVRSAGTFEELGTIDAAGAFHEARQAQQEPAR